MSTMLPHLQPTSRQLVLSKMIGRVKINIFVQRHRSSPASAVSSFVNNQLPVISTVDSLNRKEVHLDFSDYKNAFKTKTKWELVRALTVLGICSSKSFATNSLKIFNISRRYLNAELLGAVMKPLFYDQFVAGSTATEINKTVSMLDNAGVGSMIAIALEACSSTEEAKVNREKTISMMNLLSENITDCTEHIMQFRITGLFTMDLLKRITKLSDEDRLRAVFSSAKYMKTKCEADIKWIAEAIGLPQSCEEIMVGLDCLEIIGQKALETSTVLLVDAEYISINPALDVFTQALSLRTNRDKPVVWNTFQCYLKKVFDNIQQQYNFAKENNLHFGAKVVRGAYTTPEEQAAKQGNYPNPIWDSYDHTNTCYDKVVEWLISKIQKSTDKQIRFVLATHNQTSIHKAVQKINDSDIDKEAKKVVFAQLYGMCDHITYTLANQGFPTYKSVAVGTIDEAIPYLSRRAQENTTLIVNARQERTLLRKEFIDRLVKRQQISEV